MMNKAARDGDISYALLALLRFFFDNSTTASWTEAKCLCTMRYISFVSHHIRLMSAFGKALETQ